MEKEKIKKWLSDHEISWDEYDPYLVAGEAARDLGVSVQDVIDVIYGTEKTEKKMEEMYCHYCGLPATSFGFFDEPICPECGG